MGFFKDVVFEASRKWGIARYYYGDDIARELYYLPNSEPLSLMTETEKAALKVAKIADKLYSLEDKTLTKISDAEKTKRHEIYKEVSDILGDSIVTRQYSKDPSLEWHNAEQRRRSEIAEQKWKYRLELFKKNGSVEEE